MAAFGTVQKKTKNKRALNPEIMFIEKVHSCIFNSPDVSLLRNPANWEEKKTVSAFLQQNILRCRSVSAPYAHRTLNPLSEKGPAPWRGYSQSQITHAIGEHEMYINTYRWVD